jgi:hypothetical protein
MFRRSKLKVGAYESTRGATRKLESEGCSGRVRRSVQHEAVRRCIVRGGSSANRQPVIGTKRECAAVGLEDQVSAFGERPSDDLFNTLLSSPVTPHSALPTLKPFSMFNEVSRLWLP